MVLIPAFIALVLLTVWDVIRVGMKKTWRYAFKVSLNSLKLGASIPYAVMVFTAMIYGVVKVGEWTDYLRANVPNQTLDSTIVYWMLLFIALATACYIFIRVFKFMLKPMFKYTEEEQKWVDESKAKNQEWLLKHRLFFLMDKKKEKGTING